MSYPILQKLKSPVTVIILLVCYSVVITYMYLGKADLVITKDKQLTQVHDELTKLTGSTLLQKDSVRKLTEELTITKTALATASTANAWYAKNWHKVTTVTKDPGGKEVTVIEEGATDNGGSSSASSSTSNTETTGSKKTDSTAVRTVYKHDTTVTIQVHDSIEYREHIVIAVNTKKARLYAGIGGTATEKLDLAAEIKAGAAYSFTKLTYIGVEATKSGILDFSQGYKIGAYIGGKLDL